MEFLPVLDPLDRPKEGIWYSLTPSGSTPGVSVGHTCTFVPSEDGGKGRIVIVGGANPSGSFSESYAINLDNHEWITSDWKGLEARYEHCSFVSESCPQCLWVFGGAQQTGNRKCIQKLQFSDKEPQWKNVEAKGELPSPRTYHTSSACIGDKLYVFSGGEAGAAPVSDTKLHVFDTDIAAVTVELSAKAIQLDLSSVRKCAPETQGRQPASRHGHVIAAVGSKIYIHGGMAGDKFFSDMYSLDSGIMKWEKVQSKGDIPPGVAAHSAVVQGANIYIFGGLTVDGAVNSMYRFNTEKSRWTLMKFEGDLPPNRLDHSMCLLPWQLCRERNADGMQTSGPDFETINLAFAFGGMDTHSVIYNDCIVTVVK